MAGAVLRDASGLARGNRLRPETVVGALVAAADPARPDLAGVLQGLPVAGFSGSLSYRFGEDAEAGLGAVRAKTGTLTGVHALAGTVVGEDGSVMVFFAGADRVKVENTLPARDLLDEISAALAACSCAAPDRLRRPPCWVETPLVRRWCVTGTKGVSARCPAGA